MLNPFAEINWEPTVNERRTFALTLVVGFPCVAPVLLSGTAAAPFIYTLF